MSFAHGIFIFYFLPISLALHHWALRYQRGPEYHILARITLFSLTLLFYGFNHPWWLIPFVACICFDFLWANLIVTAPTERKRKLYCTLSVIQNLALLGIFKYWNFGWGVIAGVVPQWASHIPHFSDAFARDSLPAGISFYTFESLSFVIDVYRREVLPPKKATEFFAFIGMFPRFVAGPIVRYKDMAQQFQNYPKMHIEQGLVIFMIGLFYKCAFADNLAVFVPYAFNQNSQPEFLASWVGVFAYTLQIYFDFSGYSWMAIGLGWCLGFKFPENFRTPYLATSLDDHWRRWHISLSSWLRDYLYIPLGGSRGSNFKTYRNLFITMTLGGLWHGANWTYIVWGMWHGIWLCIERCTRKYFKLPGVLGQLFTLWLILVGFVLFRSANIGEAFHTLKVMMVPSESDLSLNLTAFKQHPIAVFFSFCAILYCFLFEKYTNVLAIRDQERVSKWLLAVVGLAFFLSTLLFLSNNPVPFIYYQF